MAIESVATREQGNVISEEEMRHAVDHAAPVDPGKFIPYRKLIAQLEMERSAISDVGAELMRLRSLMIAIRHSADNDADCIADLAMIGEDMVGQLYEKFDHRREDALGGVIESAKATAPRKRWEDSPAPEDRADAEDIAREAAASVGGA